MEKEKHVLVVFPHPDDEAFGVSGTMASYIERGVPVTYVCCTLGEMGRNFGNPPFANRETLPHIRKKELQNACEAIDVTDLRMLGYRDKTLEFENDQKLADHFLSYIKEINPSLIITFYPGYSVHPDHDATGRGVVRALSQLPKNERPKLHCLAFSNNCREELGEPDIHHNVQQVSEKKIACIQAHQSQIAGFMEGLPEKLEKRDPEIMEWINNEHFWSFQWKNE
jgi:bacillithiol biosynthesis deacetylase BshB2